MNAANAANSFADRGMVSGWTLGAKAHHRTLAPSTHAPTARFPRVANLLTPSRRGRYGCIGY